MQTYCTQHGRVEVGVIEHEGSTFTAYGATVQGREITAYTKVLDGEIVLTDWCGKVKLACRNSHLEVNRDGTAIIAFGLTKMRSIVGYALGVDGMLFCGRIVDDDDFDQAIREARRRLELATEEEM